MTYGYPQRPPQPQFPPAPQTGKPKNGMGTSSLVIGVAACTAAFCSPAGNAGVAVVLAVLGLVFGCIGISRAKTGVATNTASAIAGVVTSPAAVVIAFVVHVAA